MMNTKSEELPFQKVSLSVSEAGKKQNAILQL